MQKDQQPRLDVLKSSIRFARKVARSLRTDKMPLPSHVWIFALFAKVTSNAEGVRDLVGLNRPREAKLVTRAMFDTAVDICYFLDGPWLQRQLWEVARLEIAIDDYKELEFECVRRGIAVPEACKTSKKNQEVLAHYSSAMQEIKRAREQAKLSPDRFPGPWKDINRYEKMKYARLGTVAAEVGYSIAYLGDAEAHSRSSSWRDFLGRSRDGSLFVYHKPKQSDLHSVRVVLLTFDLLNKLPFWCRCCYV